MKKQNEKKGKSKGNQKNKDKDALSNANLLDSGFNSTNLKDVKNKEN